MNELCSCGQANKDDNSPWCFFCSAFGPDEDADVPAWLKWRASLEGRTHQNAIEPLPEIAA